MTTQESFTSKMNAMIKYTLENNGGTFSPHTLTARTLEKGYSVAVKKYEKILSLSAMNPMLLARYMDYAIELGYEFSENNNLKTVSIGTWINENNGLLYLDISIYELDLIEAIKLGLEHEQIAIYDFGNNTTINIERLRQVFNQ